MNTHNPIQYKRDNKNTCIEYQMAIQLYISTGIFFFFFFFSIFIALYLGLVVGEKHVYKENGLSTRPLHLIHLLVFKSTYIAS